MWVNYPNTPHMDTIMIIGCRKVNIGNFNVFKYINEYKIKSLKSQTIIFHISSQCNEIKAYKRINILFFKKIQIFLTFIEVWILRNLIYM